MPNRSKWDVLNERHQKAYQEYLRLDREIKWLEKTTCNLTCSGCGLHFETEAAFAKHYLVPDEQLLNIGYCPIKEDATS